MSNTILITGTSSGIGRSTAKHFQQQGWNVVATMRTPEKETELSALDHTLVTALDVTKPHTIRAAVEMTLARFGRIDALVNNAGYGEFGPLESSSMERIRRQFDTNVIGLLELTKAVIPQMREQHRGVIVNISSIGGRMAFPLLSLYQGTKFAVEGISEALRFELEPCGVKVKVVEPGPIRTEFAETSLDAHSNDGSIEEYQPMIQSVMAAFMPMLEQGSPPEDVAEVIWQAVTDGTDTLRYPAGVGAAELLAQRAAEDDITFMSSMKKLLGV